MLISCNLFCFYLWRKLKVKLHPADVMSSSFYLMIICVKHRSWSLGQAFQLQLWQHSSIYSIEYDVSTVRPFIFSERVWWQCSAAALVFLWRCFAFWALHVLDLSSSSCFIDPDATFISVEAHADNLFVVCWRGIQMFMCDFFLVSDEFWTHPLWILRLILIMKNETDILGIFGHNNWLVEKL